MAQREPRTSMSNFARGSELWVHQARLVLVAIRNLLAGQCGDHPDFWLRLFLLCL
jgi:hypothetical protein